MSENVEDLGVVISIDGTRTTEKGKPFVNYKIGTSEGETYVNDFSGDGIIVKVGDKVKYVYSMSANGKYKNLVSVEALPGGGGKVPTHAKVTGGGVNSFSPPSDVQGGAFFGMCANQAVQIAIKRDNIGIEIIEEEFDRLWDLWIRKKKEKNVQ